MKRQDELKPLSRDHHHGLLCSWKIRQGLSRGVPAERIKRFTDWFWDRDLRGHFELEERHIFPLLGSQDQLVQAALADHRALRELFESPLADEQTLEQIARRLDQHIRFEERVLFAALQASASPDQWARLRKVHMPDGKRPDWDDEFWA